MTDIEHAAVLRRFVENEWKTINGVQRAAIERAIEVLAWMQQYEIDEAKFGAGGEWS